MFFEIKKQQKQTNDENEKDARRKMIAIRLINSSSTSVSNSNMKKTHDYKICGYLFIINASSPAYLWIIDEKPSLFFVPRGGGEGCDVTPPNPPPSPPKSHM